MEDPPSLGRLIGYCSHLERQYLDARLRRNRYNVTPVQARTLLYLTCCQKAVTQRKLEEELRLRPSTVTGIIDRLEEKGFVVRRPSPQDARCRLISATEAGRRMADTFRSALDETDAVFQADLSEEEQRQMRALLCRMIANLENEVNGT